MRAVQKKRPRFMTPKRWFLVAAACIVTLGVWFGFYLRDVMSPRWSEEAQARSIALQHGTMTEIDLMRKHVWEEVTWVAEGRNAENEAVYLFIKENGDPETVAASSVMPEQELLDRFRSANADAEVIRITPGRFRGGPAWEIYYSEPSERGTTYFYSFYRFDESGALLDTYRLPSTTGP